MCHLGLTDRQQTKYQRFIEPSVKLCFFLGSHCFQEKPRRTLWFARSCSSRSLLAAYPLALTGLPRASITICWKVWLDSHQLAGNICKWPKFINFFRSLYQQNNARQVEATKTEPKVTLSSWLQYRWRISLGCSPHLGEKFHHILLEAVPLQLVWRSIAESFADEDVWVHADECYKFG